MRLLNVYNLSFGEFEDDVPPYAIASHRWQDEEATYWDVRKGNNTTTDGFKKIKNFCEFTKRRNKLVQADARAKGANPRIEWIWIDTCCIDRTNSQEIAENITSMFRYYEQSEECYAYLSDLRDGYPSSMRAWLQMRKSQWFTRGWTLQELLAPARVFFIAAHWDVFGHKCAHKIDRCATNNEQTCHPGPCAWGKWVLNRLLSEITLINSAVISKVRPITDVPPEEICGWILKRQTKKEEDHAYCLLGLLGIFLIPDYGERENAWSRLQKELSEKHKRPFILPAPIHSKAAMVQEKKKALDSMIAQRRHEYVQRLEQERLEKERLERELPTKKQGREQAKLETELTTSERKEGLSSMESARRDAQPQSQNHQQLEKEESVRVHEDEKRPQSEYPGAPKDKDQPLVDQAPRGLSDCSQWDHIWNQAQQSQNPHQTPLRSHTKLQDHSLRDHCYDGVDSNASTAHIEADSGEEGAGFAGGDSRNDQSTQAENDGTTIEKTLQRNDNKETAQKNGEMMGEELRHTPASIPSTDKRKRFAPGDDVWLLLSKTKYPMNINNAGILPDNDEIWYQLTSPSGKLYTCRYPGVAGDWVPGYLVSGRPGGGGGGGGGGRGREASGNSPSATSNATSGSRVSQSSSGNLSTRTSGYDVPRAVLEAPKAEKMESPDARLDVPRAKLETRNTKLDVTPVGLDIPKARLNVPKAKVDIPSRKDTDLVVNELVVGNHVEVRPLPEPSHNQSLSESSRTAVSNSRLNVSLCTAADHGLGIVSVWTLDSPHAMGSTPSPSHRRYSTKNIRTELLEGDDNRTFSKLTRQGFRGYRKGGDPKEVFKCGNVVEILIVPTPSSFLTDQSDPEQHTTRMRRFVIIDESSRSFKALPIKTYDGRGVGASGVTKAHHAIIHTSKAAPRPMQAESARRLNSGHKEDGMPPQSIRVKLFDHGTALDPTSRLDFSDVYQFDHNAIFKEFGRVDVESLSHLINLFNAVRAEVQKAANRVTSYRADWTDAAESSTGGAMSALGSPTAWTEKEKKVAKFFQEIRQFARSRGFPEPIITPDELRQYAQDDDAFRNWALIVRAGFQKEAARAAEKTEEESSNEEQGEFEEEDAEEEEEEEEVKRKEEKSTGHRQELGNRPQSHAHETSYSYRRR